MTPAQRIEELEAEVAYLRSELGMNIAATHLAVVRDALGLTPNAGRMLIALALACPKSLRRDHLFDLLDHPGDGDGTNQIAVYTYQIRKKLGRDAVHVSSHVGLSVPWSIAEQVRGLIAQAGERVAA